MTKKRITKTQIKKTLSSLSFDPNDTLFRTAVQHMNSHHCIIRAKEYLDLAMETDDPSNLEHAVEMTVLALNMVLNESKGT